MARYRLIITRKKSDRLFPDFPLGASFDNTIPSAMFRNVKNKKLANFYAKNGRRHGFRVKIKKIRSR